MRLLIPIIFILASSSVTLAQRFPSKEYQSGEVTWLGLDFTLCKLVDQFAFTNAEHLASSYIPEWNSFVNTESSKYDVKKYFMKPDMQINIDFTNEYNASINPDSLVQDKIYSLNSNLVKSDAKKYTSSGLEGMGVVMYVEYFNKNILTGSYWLTFIDLKTGDVIFIDKVTGKPRGFGIRNYWIATFLNSLKSINKKMPKWLN